MPQCVKTHWGRVTHICGLVPTRRHAIIWTNSGILLIVPLGTNVNEILSEILIFSFKKIRLNVSSAKSRPFCLGLNVLSHFAHASSSHCTAWTYSDDKTDAGAMKRLHRSFLSTWMLSTCWGHFITEKQWQDWRRFTQVLDVMTWDVAKYNHQLFKTMKSWQCPHRYTMLSRQYRCDFVIQSWSTAY